MIPTFVATRKFAEHTGKWLSVYEAGCRVNLCFLGSSLTLRIVPIVYRVGKEIIRFAAL